MQEPKVPHRLTAKRIEILPMSLEKLELGTFPAEKQIPEYQFDLMPDLPDAVGMHRSLTETSDGVHVMYYFQNYSKQTVLVFPRKMIT